MTAKTEFIVAKSVRHKKHQKEAGLPLGKKNFQIIGLGILVIIAGYVLLNGAPVEGFVPLVLSPILLVLGYCVIIPIGILYKARKPNGDKPEAATDTSRF